MSLFDLCLIRGWDDFVEGNATLDDLSRLARQERGHADERLSGPRRQLQRPEDPNEVGQFVPSLFGRRMVGLLQGFEVVTHLARRVRVRFLRHVEGGLNRQIPVVVQRQGNLSSQLFFD